MKNFAFIYFREKMLNFSKKKKANQSSFWMKWGVAERNEESSEKVVVESLDSERSEEWQHKWEVGNEAEFIKSLPRKIRFKIALSGFCFSIALFFVVFILAFFTDFFSAQIRIFTKFYQVSTITLPQYETTLSDIITLWQFLYDGRKYPQTPETMPVYQKSGILINENALNNLTKNLKIGDFPLKNIENAQINSLNLESSDSSILIFNDWLLGFTAPKPHNNGCSTNTCPTLSEKEILKKVNKKLDDLNIYLYNYAQPQITLSMDRSVVTLFYPFLLNNTPVYNRYSQIWLSISYWLFNDYIDIQWLDAWTYIYSDFPLLSRDDVLKDFRLWDKVLSAPELVYLDKWDLFVPALKFSLNDELKTMIFKELVHF